MALTNAIIVLIMLSIIRSYVPSEEGKDIVTIIVALGSCVSYGLGLAYGASKRE